MAVTATVTPRPNPHKIRHGTRLGILTFCALTVIGGATSADTLSSWADRSAKREILSFVKSVSTKGSPSFVPPYRRIAVFDNDGTLWSEQPLYFQLAYAIDRVKKLAPRHPEWQREMPFKAILNNDLRALRSLDHHGILKIVLATHAGMTTMAFAKASRTWLANARHPRFNRPYSAIVYKPMLELMAHLRRNRFKIYIVSGGGQEFIRAFAGRVYGIPPENVIGSSLKSKFVLRDGKPVLIKQRAIGSLNDTGEKAVNINLHIGRRPIMAVGNSDGDLAMLQYTAAGSGPRLMVLIRHDDARREYKYDRNSKIGRLDKALDAALNAGWTVVSMKHDFRRIFAFEK